MWRSIATRCRSKSIDVIEGEGLMHIAGKDHVVRKHDHIYLPPGVEHSIAKTGLVDLVFLMVTSPVTDEQVK